MHIFHNWKKWNTVRKEVIEHHHEMLLPYWVQDRECSKCGLCQIKVSECKMDWTFPLMSTVSPIDNSYKYEGKPQAQIIKRKPIDPVEEAIKQDE